MLFRSHRGPVNGAGGGAAAEHGAHVGVDHAGALGDGPDEIGRASCRERVSTLV